MLFAFIIQAQAQTSTRKIITVPEARILLKSDITFEHFAQIPPTKISSRFIKGKYASMELFENTKIKVRTYLPKFVNNTQKEEFIKLLRCGLGRVVYVSNGGPGSGGYYDCVDGNGGCVSYEENGWTIHVYL